MRIGSHADFPSFLRVPRFKIFHNLFIDLCLCVHLENTSLKNHLWELKLSWPPMYNKTLNEEMMCNLWKTCVALSASDCEELSRRTETDTISNCFQPVTFFLTMTKELFVFLYTGGCLPETWMCLKSKWRSVNLRKHGVGSPSIGCFMAHTRCPGSFSVGVYFLSFLWWQPLTSLLECGGTTLQLVLLAHSWRESDFLVETENQRNPMLLILCVQSQGLSTA